MDYQVLALKYRPAGFSEVVGQTQVTDVLKGALLQDRIAKAYIFSGPRGCGKTTCARILAKALNCEDRQGAEPCGKCDSCLAISQSASLAVIEIDAASTGGVSDIREMREEAALASIGGRYKVYILDEAHQITTAGNNALLKTLEEPPPRTVFILATTEPQKMLPTVHSRCQHFHFHLLTVDDIMGRLSWILERENIEVEDEVVRAVAQRADGSMRDGLTLLDQVIASAEGRITLEQVSEILGLTRYEHFFNLTEAFLAKDGAQAVRELHTILDQGLEIREFAMGLGRYFRNLLLIKLDPTLLETEMLADEIQRCRQYADSFQQDDLLHLSRVIGERADKIRYASQPRIQLETLMVEISRLESRVLLTEIMARLNRLGSGSTGPLSAASTGASTRSTSAPTTASPRGSGRTKREQPAPSTSPPRSEATPPPRSEPTPAPSVKEPAPAAAPAGSRWDQFVEQVSQAKKSLGSFLGQTSPGATSESSFTLLLETPFQLAMLDTADHLRLLSEKYEVIYGKRVEIRLELRGDQVAPPSSAVEERISPERARDARREQDLKDHAGNGFIEDLLQRFDGEILED